MTIKEQLAWLDACNKKAFTHPKKCIRVNPGCYYLVVDGYLWTITTNEDKAKGWIATTDDDSWYAPTKRELLERFLN